MFVFVPLGVEDLGDRRPWGTIGLIAGMVLLHAILPRDAAEVLVHHHDRFEPWTWLTSALLHADWAHVLGNMLFFFTVGIVVEGITGTRRFLLLYAALAFASGLAEQLLFWGGRSSSVGASGVICGFMAIGFLWAPRTRIKVAFLHFGFTRGAGVQAIALGWLVAWWIGWDLLVTMFTGLWISTPLLHTIGAAAGFAAGYLCLELGFVDTKGEDWFAIRERERDDDPDRLRHVSGRTPEQQARVDWIRDHAGPLLGGALVALGGIVLVFFVWTGPGPWVPRFLVAAALVGAGVWIYRVSDSPEDREPDRDR